MNLLTRIILAIVLSFSLATAIPVLANQAPQTHQQFVQVVDNSVVLLYSQTESGSMEMRCTATAYKKIVDGYRFVSASHCVSGETDAEQKAQKYYITADALGEKTFLSAILIEAGDRSVGDDFSIFEVKTTNTFDITPLGDSSVIQSGDRIINIAAPYGLGKQYFEGYISKVHLDRPPIDTGDVQWTDIMLVEIGSGPGSSGSAIVSDDQHAIIGFLVGGTSSTIGAICVPVNRFKIFEASVDAGTYKKSKKTEENEEDKNNI